MGELRRLLGLLRVDDSIGDSLPQPRLAGVPALLESIRGAGLRSTLEVSGDSIELAPGLELNAYRIIQEALTNSLKHARASEVRVHVSFTPGALELEIIDDGLTSALPNGSGGQGLIGMRERALLYGGELEVSQRDSQGYRVWVRLPVESAR